MAITNEPTTVSVDIGGSLQTRIVGTQGMVSYVQLPLIGRLGPVTLAMQGRVAYGPAISNAAPSTGFVSSLIANGVSATDDMIKVNFNCVAIEV